MSLFATVSRRSEPASYLRLFLGNIANTQASQPLSRHLREYVFTVVQHAAQFASNPGYRVPKASLEAIDLAFDIRQEQGLVQELLDLKNADEIGPDLARKILRQFQADTA